MPLSRRDLLRAATVLPAVATLAGCGGAPDTQPTATAAPVGGVLPPAHPGGTLLWPQPSGIDTLDPHTSTFGGGFAASLVYDTLFRRRPGPDPGVVAIEPYLAASFEQPDAVTLNLALRDAASFHDSPPVAARRV